MTVDRLIYRIGLGVIITGIVFYIMQTYMSLDFFSFLPECYFHKYTGYFCFGCGSTRAVRELLKGHFLKSGYYNMNILYLFFCFFMFYDLLQHNDYYKRKNTVYENTTYTWIYSCIDFCDSISD